MRAADEHGLSVNAIVVLVPESAKTGECAIEQLKDGSHVASSQRTAMALATIPLLRALVATSTTPLAWQADVAAVT